MNERLSHKPDGTPRHPSVAGVLTCGLRDLLLAKDNFVRARLP